MKQAASGYAGAACLLIYIQGLLNWTITP